MTQKIPKLIMIIPHARLHNLGWSSDPQNSPYALQIYIFILMIDSHSFCIFLYCTSNRSEVSHSQIRCKYGASSAELFLFGL